MLRSAWLAVGRLQSARLAVEMLHSACLAMGFLLIFSLVPAVLGAGGSGLRVRSVPSSCPIYCRCLGDLLDCSRGDLHRVPENLPEWVVQLDLSHNKLSSIKASSLSHLHNLRELRLNHNQLKSMPDLGPLSANITLLSLTNNKISAILPEHLTSYQSLETLDLSYNLITEIKTASFPKLQLKYLYINGNQIKLMESGAFDNLSTTLQVLKLNKNRISHIPLKMFKLSNLQHLELNRNRLRSIDGLVFQGLNALKTLSIQKNRITRLMDGAFFDLDKMEILQLDHNNLTEISKGWLYGLHMLQHLHLSQNAISKISPDAWEFCQKLSELDLSFNQLTRLEESGFMGLNLLGRLFIGDNQISYIADGAFNGLSSLNTLDLKTNEISWTIEDMNGAFSGLENLKKLTLQSNRIRSITIKAFSWLDSLEYLDLSNNAIVSMQDNAFSQMKKLHQVHLNTSSLLCDCHLQWLPRWLAENNYETYVNASCAHPQILKGRNIFMVNPEGFVCDDFPKPQIIAQPETQSALKGSNVSFICSAASSSDSPLTFAWKRDNEPLNNAEIENYAHVRNEGQEVMEYTTILRLQNVEFNSEGKYQCVVSNDFGTTYSVKAKLTVNMLPSFISIPTDLSIRAGSTARLECDAIGHPSPEIAWQKNGGTDFPAARERRMHVMPDDDVFFMVNVKMEDSGIYSCTAQNSAGSISTNITLTVLETPSFMRPLVDQTVSKGGNAVLQCIANGSPAPKVTWIKDDKPLVVTERHFFAAGDKILVIVDTDFEDAGKYTCELSNVLGTERGNINLSVIPNITCYSTTIATKLEDGGWGTVGIVIIVVVCCVVGTSLVWVAIIYHTRRKNEDCSVTNTDETNLPDTPSYLSSQGTLAERQDGYVSSENGNHHFATSLSGYYLQQRNSNGICHFDNGSEADLDAAIDPLLFHYVGAPGSLFLKGNVYDSDSCDVYHSGYNVDQRTASSNAYESEYLKQKAFGTYAEQREDSSSKNKCSPETFIDGLDAVCNENEDHGNEISPDHDPCGLKPNSEQSNAASCSSYMGTFGKPLWRARLDSFPGHVQRTVHQLPSHNDPSSSLSIQPGTGNKEDQIKVLPDETGILLHKQPSDNYRTTVYNCYEMDT
ncbi:leucine-rich repeats and immunoglobulin-like domains protein 3 [Pelobates fuscus]|uniref:leucine-rich repeats and immunoglobulin-like domains protein 3 n=1 Tax=Pelobates fuscus TaxID=191477 RepID=UPI002FE4E686